LIKAFLKANTAGIALSVALAVLAFLLADFLHLNEVLLALLFGIIAGNVIRIPSNFDDGIKFSASGILEIAIVLLAFGINYQNFINLGYQSIVIVVLTIVIVLGITIWLAKKLKCPGSTGWLVGFGTAICGSAAIAALAPSVSKDKTDIGIALAVVNLFGLLGMIVLPFITTYWLNDTQNGILIGASLHSVGNVAGAGFGINDTVGELSITVKMGRVALLTPALLAFNYFLPNTHVEGQKFKLPWYLTAFIIISLLVTFITLPSGITQFTKAGSNLLLATAMAAIGLKVSFKTLISSGKKGLIFGAILFAIQLIVIGVLMYALASVS
jgi:uncharacterized integral membrane protein (TIGR00698 family)